METFAPLINAFVNNLCRRPPHYAPAPAIDLQPIDLESSAQVTCDVGFLCANFSLPKPLLLISICGDNVDIIPVSSFNVITVVVFASEIKIHLRQTSFVYNTDVASNHSHPALFVVDSLPQGCSMARSLEVLRDSYIIVLSTFGLETANDAQNVSVDT